MKKTYRKRLKEGKGHWKQEKRNKKDAKKCKEKRTVGKNEAGKKRRKKERKKVGN